MISEIERTHNGIMLSHSPGFVDVRPFTWNGWHERDAFYYVLDISDTRENLEPSSNDVSERFIRNAESKLDLERTDRRGAILYAVRADLPGSRQVGRL